MNDELQEMLDANEELITILCNRLAESKKGWQDIKSETIRLFLIPYSFSAMGFGINVWLGLSAILLTSAFFIPQFYRLNRHQKFFAADYQKELDQCYERREILKSIN